MNVGRYSHSTTLIDGTIYVVGGFNDGYLSSVELLNVKTEGSTWSIFDLPDFTPRTDPLVRRLSSTKLLIAGGFNEGQNLRDVSVIDLKA